MVRVSPKKGPQSIGKSRVGLTTKIHSIVADETLPIICILLFVSVAEDIEVELLIVEVAKSKSLIMDKAYEGYVCRAKAKSYGMIPVVPPKSNRKEPWE